MRTPSPVWSKRLIIAVVLSICLLPTTAHAEPAESQDVLRAGTAKIDITPKKPVKMAGYAGRTGLSKDVHDPLSARVVAFENDGKRLVLVSSDL